MTARRRLSSGSTPPRSCAPTLSPTATPVATSSSAPASSAWTCPSLKNIVFTGGRALQLRLEAFNALNQPIWGDPDMNMSSSTYGRINTTRSPMRELQIGVKFSF